MLAYKIDLYFHDYRLAMEINENCQNDRNFDYEIKRQNSLKQELDCAFIRVDEQKDVDIFVVINGIFTHIKQSSNQLTKQSTKKHLIDNVSMRLLGS